MSLFKLLKLYGHELYGTIFQLLLCEFDISYDHDSFTTFYSFTFHFLAVVVVGLYFTVASSLISLYLNCFINLSRGYFKSGDYLDLVKYITCKVVCCSVFYFFYW